MQSLKPPAKQVGSQSASAIQEEFSFSCFHLWGLEGVLWREVDVQEEDAALVDGAGRAEDGGDPLVDVVTLRSGAGNEIEENSLTKTACIFKSKAKKSAKKRAKGAIRAMTAQYNINQSASRLNLHPYWTQHRLLNFYDVKAGELVVQQNENYMITRKVTQ